MNCSKCGSTYYETVKNYMVYVIFEEPRDSIEFIKHVSNMDKGTVHDYNSFLENKMESMKMTDFNRKEVWFCCDCGNYTEGKKIDRGN